MSLRRASLQLDWVGPLPLIPFWEGKHDRVIDVECAIYLWTAKHRNGDGSPLYVGQAKRGLLRRQSQHIRSPKGDDLLACLNDGHAVAVWVADCAFANESDAVRHGAAIVTAAETALIHLLQPEWNLAQRDISSKDVCQLVAYLANFRAAGDRLAGVLLYAVDRPTVPPTRMRLLGHDVYVLELNLNQPWQELDRALHDLVEVLAATESGEASHPHAAAV